MEEAAIARGGVASPFVFASNNGAAAKLRGHLRSEGIDQAEHKRPIDLLGRVRSLFACDGVGMHVYRWFQRPREQ